MEMLPVNQEKFFLVETTVFDKLNNQTKMLNIFPIEIWFDEVVIGIKNGFIHQENIDSCQVTIWHYNLGNRNLVHEYDKWDLIEPRKEYLKSLQKSN